MRDKMRLVVFGMAFTASAFAHNGRTDYAVCRTSIPNGNGLVFTIVDEPSLRDDARSLFQGGGGQGSVSVRSVTPLKIQYRTEFAVRSSWSKRWMMQIGADRQIDGVHFLLQSEGKFDRLLRFPATISYGSPDLKYEAECQLHQAE